MEQSIFKAYDIRGVYPTQLDEDAVYKIAQAYCKFLSPKTVALGRDVRASGGPLWEAAKRGLTDHGVNVIDIGVISTDMLYFAVANYGYDGGITISASHNPREYNGMKMVREGSIPISGDTGIYEIRDIAMGGYKVKQPLPGNVETKYIRQDYLEKCLSFIDVSVIKPYTVVANAMFGPALQNVIKMNLPITLKMINEVPDGSFPKGPPNPLLDQNQAETVQLVLSQRADLGVAWDGDADRFFIFDEGGRFIPGYYLTAFLGMYFASKEAGAKIVCDPRVTWAVLDDVSSSGGIPLINKSGHSFIKERMRRENAVFAGESSGHYYFRDFFYSDNGLIPFLIILEIMSTTGKKASEIFNRYFNLYPISGEINIQTKSQDEIKTVMRNFELKYHDAAKTEKVDGLSVEYPDWRANVRASNTEPLIRLNVEANSPELLKEKTEEVLSIIHPT